MNTTKKNKKIKIFVNCFDFFSNAIKKRISADFYYFFTSKGGALSFLFDYFDLRKKLRKGELSDMDVIHISNWFNFQLIKYKRENQIWIAHTHGIHAGLDDEIALSQSKGLLKIIGSIIIKPLSRNIRKSIKQFDAYIVSIPNALPYAKKIRSDATWIPNPIEERFFDKILPKKLEGKPSIFMPSRLHSVKNPDFAFNLFKEILKKYPEAKLHIIKYPARHAQEDRYTNTISKLSKHIISHELIPREDLLSYYRGADLVLGAFNKNYFYANMNLVELEAMAAEGAVICHDKYEFIKMDMSEMKKLAFKLIEDKKFRIKYIKESKEYVKRIHGPDNVAKEYKKVLSKFFKFTK